MEIKKQELNPSEEMYEYSEEPEKLREIVKELKISVEQSGYDYYFDGDKEKRIILNVEIERKGTIINFSFGMSTRDTECFYMKYSLGDEIRIEGKYYRSVAAMSKIKKEKKKIIEDLYYTILSCCGTDRVIPDRFNDFCDELGYDNNSIKDRNTYDKCMEQKIKIERIFTEEAAWILPC